jgi:hypothetical protein
VVLVLGELAVTAVLEASQRVAPPEAAVLAA